MIRNDADLRRSDRHGHVLDALEAGIDAAHPTTVIENALDLSGSTLTVDGDSYDLDGVDRVFVLGGGKAGGQVAVALEAVLGDRIDGGVVVTDDPVDAERIEVLAGDHPLPSAANVDGTRKLLDLADEAHEDDLVLAVISGGGSALLCSPIPELPLGEYRELTDTLLRSGATIDEINAIRRHLSTFKGGQFAATLAPATTVGLVFSDVVGNRLDVIASGPTAPDPSTYEECRSVLERYDVRLPDAADRAIEAGIAGDRPETPTAGDPLFDRVRNHVLADGRTALEAAARSLRSAGYASAILSTRIEGEASEVGTVHAGIGRECLAAGEPFEPPVALLSGGETTVTVEGDGNGGPNQEFALGAALNVRETELLIAGIDTDGIDGDSDVAGALVDGETVPENDVGAARSALRDNDAFGYLHGRDRLLDTGPTGTNVNDLRIVLAGSP